MSGAPEDIDVRGARAKESLLQRHGLKLIISLILGAGLAWAMLRGGLPLIPDARAFAKVRLWTIPVYVGSLVVMHYYRAIRWRHLLRPVGEVSSRAVLSVSWIAFGAILLSPLRSGELVRPYLITKRSTVKMWEATGTVGAERVIDGVIVSVVLFLGLQLSTPQSPLPDHVGDLPVPASAVPGAAYTALAVFIGAFALMAIFFYARAWARRMTHAVIGIVSVRLADMAAGMVERVADGLRFLPNASRFVPFLIETLAYWAINVAGMWLLAWGSGLDSATPAIAAVTMGCIGIGILVPAGPGYFGAFQLSTFMALSMYFPEEMLKGPGAAYVFLLYVTQMVWHMIAMAVGFAIHRRTKAPEPAA